MPKKNVPINRVNKFFSEEDFNLEVSFGREAIEGDGNFVVILYRVDRNRTESDDIYNEAVKDGIKFFPPVELRVIPIMNEPENKAYNSGSGSLRYLQDGQLTFGIYDAQLDELGVELNYGDYIGYQVSETDIRYFSVSNDGIKNYDNKHTIMGYKGAFRTVLCASVEEDEFRGL
tara:strand:+ start:609 stop:1130 length:522 start_codon:yes stop_codon:yes gene_type:complete